MFRSKTLFIVGAGASKEVGIPIGTELVERIARLLYFEIDLGGLQKGDHQFFNNIRRSLGNDETNRHLKAARQISEGLGLANSIDSYIDTHQHNSKISFWGKTAIIHTILQAERKSALFIDKMSSRDTIDFKNLEGTWYVQFFKILMEQVPLNNLESLFNNIAIVCFNYDRCIQHFLICAVSSHYSIHYEKSRELVESLQILHPYGSVGKLPIAGSNNEQIEFGQNNNVEIARLSESIKTYTEQIEDNELLKKVREEVKKAETIVFLGFGFHPQNMNLLKPERNSNARQIYATAKGISNSDKAVIENQIRSVVNTNSYNQLLKIQVRNDLSCAELFPEYRRTLATN